MKVFLNGIEKELEGNQWFLSEVLSCFGQTGAHVAVALNKSFVPKSCYKSQEVQEGDLLEVVTPHPGG